MKKKSIMAVVMIALIAAAGFGGYTLGNQSGTKNPNIATTNEQQPEATDHNSMSMLITQPYQPHPRDE